MAAGAPFVGPIKQEKTALPHIWGRTVQPRFTNDCAAKSAF
ncbi:hypothetical protein Z948_2454 [Sulfitobacter donghicola DSW-25 = KCTC 12864 = JCM 14565]|uniref:Uncharacterized protein n=1 Tax=Sulfitobacter donghicola DSW-25 = KCTC 12864 = JCM 14565 TaxID=1300350 RepID=A0A073ICQ7_9RHOB|nr:hypothetical protein DSW25_17470 [Sulfitobacter donghicola DSW-25 = KCTC 12864 = JCM 14565]KIN68723.1 hypothetical protein Z948_2454 [Sulfitobacter donghicola DSW-25 = KCTC 12864 = JCM 14565]